MYLNKITCLVLICTFYISQSYSYRNNREVILSAGLGNFTHEKLVTKINTFAAYKDMNIISGSSALVYFFGMNATLDTYNTSDPDISAEQFQLILRNKGLKAYPCIYCDSTIGNCKNINDRLNNLYLQQQTFIDETILRAQKYGWHGYTIDIEPDQNIDEIRLTNFMLDWGNQLNKNNMTLYIWIGGPTAYHMETLYNTNVDIKLITMDTYAPTYENFIEYASEPLVQINNVSKLGFGLLSSAYKINPNTDSDTIIFNLLNSTTQDTMMQITKWTKISNVGALSIWASIIPPSWYYGLYLYLK